MRDLAQLYDDIDGEHSVAARRWYAGLKRALLSLEEHPHRCPRAPEGGSLRHLLYGRKPHVYRLIFRVTDSRQEVDVLHIRHGVRRPARGVGAS